MSTFSIKEDLETRPLEDQVNILMRSGPTYQNPEMVANILGITVSEVNELNQKAEAKWAKKPSKRKPR